MQLPQRATPDTPENVSWATLKTQDAIVRARVKRLLDGLTEKRPRHVNLVEALINPDGDPGPELQDIIEAELDKNERTGSYLMNLIKLFTGETGKTVAGMVTSAALVQAAQSLGAINFEAKPSEEGALGFVQQATVEDWTRAAIQFASDNADANRNRNNAILLTNFIIQSLTAIKAGRGDSVITVGARIISRSFIVPHTISGSMDNLPWLLEFAANAGPGYIGSYFAEQYAKFAGKTEEGIKTAVAEFIPGYLKEYETEARIAMDAVYDYTQKWVEDSGIERQGFSPTPDTFTNYIADRMEETFTKGLGIEPATEHYVNFEDIPVVGEINEGMNLVANVMSVTMQMLESGTLTLTKELAAILSSGAVILRRRENGGDTTNAGAAYMFVRVLYQFLSRFSNIQ